MRIFISHSSKDAELAAKVCEKVEAGGHSCFLAPRDIRSGCEYAEEIINGIDGSDVLLLLLSLVPLFVSTLPSPEVFHICCNNSNHLKCESNNRLPGLFSCQMSVRVHTARIRAWMDFRSSKVSGRLLTSRSRAEGW